ncbi:MAG: NAD(P)H-hydrate epimerase, partial [Leptospira sp.]|nr:NAD(P)H-hydrate epimerase [Leptospira sp.]
MEVAEKISFLFTDPESRALDKFAIHEKKIPSNLLMGFAAISIFDKYREMFRGKKIIIVCGTGNNGGDGLAISWFLYSSGESVSVFQKEGKYSEETEFYRSLLSNSGIRIESINFLDEYLRNCNNDPAVIVDCLLGTGFKPPLTGSYSEIIESINSFRKSNPLSEILSVDAASGFYPGPDSVSTGIRPDILAEIGTEKYNSIFISDPDIKKSVHEIGFPVKEF